MPVLLPGGAGLGYHPSPLAPSRSAAIFARCRVALSRWDATHFPKSGYDPSFRTSSTGCTAGTGTGSNLGAWAQQHYDTGVFLQVRHKSQAMPLPWP